MTGHVPGKVQRYSESNSELPLLSRMSTRNQHFWVKSLRGSRLNQTRESVSMYLSLASQDVTAISSKVCSHLDDQFGLLWSEVLLHFEILSLLDDVCVARRVPRCDPPLGELLVPIHHGVVQVHQYCKTVPGHKLDYAERTFHSLQRCESF